MRDFRIDQLDSSSFEGLIGHIGQRVLGMGTLIFAAGPDGGRDGRFEGTAETYPSAQAPWKGKFILQAKHTSDRSASCSDGSFFGNRSSVVSKEVPRILVLRKAGEVDNYMLFTNRRLTASKEPEIRLFITSETGVPNVAVLGIEHISLVLERNPEIVSVVGLDRLLGPIRFHAADLREIIEAFHDALQSTASGLGGSPHGLEDYADLADKNAKNELTELYFRTIRSRSAPYFGQLSDFLKNPINSAVAERYQSLATELTFKVAGRRGDFGVFDQVFAALYDEAIRLVPALADRRDLLWVFLHFMYWDCDLGET